MSKSEELRKQILSLTTEYYEETFGTKKKIYFRPGDRISYGGRYFDNKEMENLIDASLDFWLTSGRYSDTFEENFSEFLDIRHCSLTNSGSSANLLAFSALTSLKLGDKRIKKGDEVITVACGFPTTVNPIIQYGAIPVFVDVTIPQYNIDTLLLEEALSEKTKAVMVAHTLGNPFDIKLVKAFCDKHDLWLIEDNCDALGSEYTLNGKTKYTGTFGDLGTSSFYPPHHMTMGEGGAVYTDSNQLWNLVESFRDWGRDCWCHGGKDNTCEHRFTGQFGNLPFGYDHKYTYSHFGYNLKVTDMQSAIGCAQIDKLPEIIQKRQENWDYLRKELDDLSDVLILPEPCKNSKPSWFGFVITVKEGAPFSRAELVEFIEEKNIQTRMLFAGNLVKHPCFDEMRSTGEGYRVIGDLQNTDYIMNNTFWVGVYPGMTKEKLDYMITTIKNMVGSFL